MKVGDKVAWSGEYFHSFKEGKTIENLLNGENVSDVTNSKFLSGENYIVEIGTVILDIDFKKLMVRLDNDKVFSIEKVTLITE